MAATSQKKIDFEVNQLTNTISYKPQTTSWHLKRQISTEEARSRLKWRPEMHVKVRKWDSLLTIVSWGSGTTAVDVHPLPPLVQPQSGTLLQLSCSTRASTCCIPMVLEESFHFGRLLRFFSRCIVFLAATVTWSSVGIQCHHPHSWLFFSSLLPTLISERRERFYFLAKLCR